MTFLLPPTPAGGRQPAPALRAAATALLIAAAAGGCGREEAFPQRPIVLVCPWSAGGGTDRVSRQLAVLLERDLGVPVNVVNATGGAGVTGHTRGALARPDGYTLTTITPELNMLHWRGLTNITYRDFQPLMLVNRDDAALFVRAEAPWQSPEDLLRDIRARPRSLKASGTAWGGIWHLSVAGWLSAAGLQPGDVIWLSINGAAPSLQELMAGGVDLVCCSVPEAQSLLDAKQIRCLAVMAERRLEGLPNVPTLKEGGIDWSVRGWRGLALPKGVPEERRRVLQQAIERVATSPEYLDFLRTAGFGAAAEGPEQFTTVLRNDDQRYGALLTGEAFRDVRRQRFGPLVFPVVIGVLLLAVLGALVASGGLRPIDGGQALTVRGLDLATWAVAWVVLYVLLAEWLGYLLTAAALLLLLFWRLGVRWQVAAGVTLVLVPATYQFFAVWLRVPLPWGLLGW